MIMIVPAVLLDAASLLLMVNCHPDVLTWYSAAAVALHMHSHHEATLAQWTKLHSDC